MVYRVLLFLMLINASAIAQTAHGRVKDSIRQDLADISVLNLTNKAVALTDVYGSFVITAEKGDTLLFSSLFYEEQKMVVTRKHLKTPIYILLKEKLNVLADVVVTDSMPVIALDEKAYNAMLQLQIENDRKANPYLYGMGSPGQVNLLYLVTMVGRLIGSKKEVRENKGFISYEQLKDLFSVSDFFTPELLVARLGIPEDKTYLFYGFCESKTLRQNLLEAENEFLLLDKLVNLSAEFLDMLKQSGN